MQENLLIFGPMDPDVYSVVANGNSITLSLGDYEEPNNGRCVRPAVLTVNDVDLTKVYLGDWNKLVCNLDRMQFASDDKQYCFIPQEGPGIVMDTKTLKTIRVGHAGFYFVGNSFYGHQHLLVDQKVLVVTNLLTGQSVEYGFNEEDERRGTYAIRWAEFLNPDLLKVHYDKDQFFLFELSTRKITH